MIYNEELEQSTIGNLLLDEHLDVNSVNENDFYFPANKKILKAILRLKSLNHPVTDIYLKVNELKIDYDYLSRCTDLGIVTTNYWHNCMQLKKFTAARELHELASKLSQSSYDNLDGIISNAKSVISKVENETAFDDMKIMDLDKTPYQYEESKKGYIPTGFDGIDDKLNDLAPKLVTLVTGRSHEGKTTFVRQVIANAIEKGNKTLWIMGENYTQNELERLYEIVIGRDSKKYITVKENKRYKKVPNEETLKALNLWHRGKLKILHKSEAKLKNTEELFAIIEKQILRNKPNLIVIDNLMSVLSSSAIEKNEKQSEFMQRCCDICKLHNTHLILVLHPNKMYSKGKRMEYEQISGSSDLANKADNILVIRKAHDEIDISNGIGGFIDIEKNKIWGDLGTIETHFDKENNSLVEYNSEQRKMYVKKFDLDRFIPKKVVYYNGTEQEFKNGEM